MNLSYEICKKLYDAGFPMIEHDSDGICKDYPTYITLEELIDALGEDFGSLELGSINLDNGDTTWLALSKDKEKGGEGKTPLEAVANLYLALHDKKEN